MWLFKLLMAVCLFDYQLVSQFEMSEMYKWFNTVLLNCLLVNLFHRLQSLSKRHLLFVIKRFFPLMNLMLREYHFRSCPPQSNNLLLNPTTIRFTICYSRAQYSFNENAFRTTSSDRCQQSSLFPGSHRCWLCSSAVPTSPFRS